MNKADLDKEAREWGLHRLVDNQTPKELCVYGGVDIEAAYLAGAEARERKLDKSRKTIKVVFSQYHALHENLRIQREALNFRDVKLIGECDDVNCVLMRTTLAIIEGKEQP